MSRPPSMSLPPRYPSSADGGGGSSSPAFSSCDTLSTISTTYSKRSSSLSEFSPPSSRSSSPLARSCMTVRTLEESLMNADDDGADGDDNARSRPRTREAGSAAESKRTASLHAHLTFRRFPREVADYPEITVGPALGIGWDPLGPDETVDLDEHESAKPEERKTHRELRMVVFQRWNVLVEAGYTRKEIEVEMKKIERARKHDLTACEGGKKKKSGVLGVIKSSITGGSRSKKGSGADTDEESVASANGTDFSKSLNRSFSKPRLDRSFSKRLGKKSGSDRNVGSSAASKKGKVGTPLKPRRGKRGSILPPDDDDDDDKEETKGGGTPSPPRRSKKGSVHTGSAFAQRCQARMRDAKKVAAPPPPSPQQQ